jgi:hypothetical protein
MSIEITSGQRILLDWRKSGGRHDPGSHSVPCESMGTFIGPPDELCPSPDIGIGTVPNIRES